MRVATSMGKFFKAFLFGCMGSLGKMLANGFLSAAASLARGDGFVFYRLFLRP